MTFSQTFSLVTIEFSTHKNICTFRVSSTILRNRCCTITAKLLIILLSSISPQFKERVNTSLCSQISATVHHPVSGENIRNFTPYLSKIHFNIILPSKPIFASISLPLKISRLSRGCCMISKHTKHPV